MYKHLANLTTITGLIIVSFSFLKYYLTKNIIYLVYACIGFLFDFLDGWLARKFNIKSKIGNILDKIVDKLNQSMLLLLLIIMFYLRIKKIKSKYSSIHGKLKTSLFPLTIILYHFKNPYAFIYLNLITFYNYITLLF
jgi:hypothetical protein